MALIYLCAGAANAHLPGNFTINSQAEVQTAGDSIVVRYTVDVAEIPTF